MKGSAQEESPYCLHIKLPSLPIADPYLLFHAYNLFVMLARHALLLGFLLGLLLSGVACHANRSSVQFLILLAHLSL